MRANFVTNFDCNQDKHSLTRVQLVKGQSRAVRHAINASVSLTADMLQVRRDAALVTSRNLLDSSKEQLRRTPLESPLLFGDQVRSVLDQDRHEHERQALLRGMVTASRGMVTQQKKGGSDDRKRKRTSKSKKKAAPATSLPSVQPPPSANRTGFGAGANRTGFGAGRGATSGRGTQQQRRSGQRGRGRGAAR